HSVRDVGKDALFVQANGSRKFDERCELGPRGPGEPLLERAACTAWPPVVERFSEGLFEQIRPIERLVVALNGGELLVVRAGEVPWRLQESVSRPLEGLPRRRALHLAPQSASHIVDRARGKLRNVEAIEDELDMGRSVPERLQIAAGHVEGDQLQR